MKLHMTLELKVPKWPRGAAAATAVFTQHQT